MTQEATAHEFSGTHEAVFGRVARSARAVALAGATLAAALLLGGAASALRPPTHMPPRVALVVGALTAAGAIPAGIASWRLLGASRAVHAVATTAGRDVEHLMVAVAHLRGAFMALVAMLAVDALVLAVIVALMAPVGLLWS